MSLNDMLNYMGIFRYRVDLIIDVKTFFTFFIPTTFFYVFLTFFILSTFFTFMDLIIELHNNIHQNITQSSV